MKEYKKIQYGTLIIAVLIPIIIFIAYATYFQIGSKPIPFVPAIILVGILIATLLLFYKITIYIDKNKIIAVFGIGLLKREFLINDINFNTIENVKFNALTGIGLRLTSKGWLWNVKVGDAIYFKNKKGDKTFLVGTDDYKEILEILINNNGL